MTALRHRDSKSGAAICTAEVCRGSGIWCDVTSLVYGNRNVIVFRQRLNSNGGVVIEHKNFEKIKVYDCPAALFYLDPPYHETEKYYDAAFSEDDHYRLKQCLNTIKGRFILSYNDDDFVRELYKDFNIFAVERSNSLSKGKYKEVIITNY